MVGRFGSGRARRRPPAPAQPNASPRCCRIEEAAGLHSVAGYMELRKRAERCDTICCGSYWTADSHGKRVVGYGAPGKGNTLLNYCGIRSDLLEYTVDRNPYKHGRFTPGTRIPIYDPVQIDKDRPDVVLVLPWNLETELTEQLAYISRVGRRARVPPSRAARQAGPGHRTAQEQGLVMFTGLVPRETIRGSATCEYSSLVIRAIWARSWCPSCKPPDTT